MVYNVFVCRKQTLGKKTLPICSLQAFKKKSFILVISSPSLLSCHYIEGEVVSVSLKAPVIPYWGCCTSVLCSIILKGNSLGGEKNLSQWESYFDGFHLVLFNHSTLVILSFIILQIC